MTSTTGPAFGAAPRGLAPWAQSSAFGGGTNVNVNLTPVIATGVAGVLRPVGAAAVKPEFPPEDITMRKTTIPSYLYQQYNDDDTLQSFVAAYNDIAQAYTDWFNSLNLPVYTLQQGDLLDWVAEGLYGISRPYLPSGSVRSVGPFNTATLNSLKFNQFKNIQPSQFYLTTDDVFKRIITWNFYKGDGNRFNVRWLKRRISRFLTGTSGGPGVTDQTYDVSVTFGPNNVVDINFFGQVRTWKGGAIFNRNTFNSTAFNAIVTQGSSQPVGPLVPILKAAMDSGVLQVPFQYTFVVNTTILPT